MVGLRLLGVEFLFWFDPGSNWNYSFGDSGCLGERVWWALPDGLYVRVVVSLGCVVVSLRVCAHRG